MSIWDRIRGKPPALIDAPEEVIPESVEGKMALLDEAADPGKKKRVYEAIAKQQYDEGVSHMEALGHLREAQLEALGSRGMHLLHIVVSDHGCDECRPLDQRPISLNEAMEQKLLPVKNCKNNPSGSTSEGWCDCVYVPEIAGVSTAHTADAAAKAAAEEAAAHEVEEEMPEGATEEPAAEKSSEGDSSEEKTD